MSISSSNAAALPTALRKRTCIWYTLYTASRMEVDIDARIIISELKNLHLLL
jgi:hypothetical protein